MGWGSLSKLAAEAWAPRYPLLPTQLCAWLMALNETSAGPSQQWSQVCEDPPDWEDPGHTDYSRNPSGPAPTQRV